MITINELFSGIGAFRKAFINLNIPHEIVGISEIDKFAIQSYNAIYGETKNYGDISKLDKLNYADLWTYGFPCQDISVAGLQAGIKKGETRSGLLYSVKSLLLQGLLDDELPKFLIMENVKNLVGKKFIGDFEKWLEFLNGVGYNNYWKVLNAKNYGIPQNRERVFCISIRKDVDKGFKFPKELALTKTLGDLLDEEVEDKFYLTNEQIEMIENSTFKHNQKRIQSKDCSDTLCAIDAKNPKCTKVANMVGKKWNYQSRKPVFSPGGISPTLVTCGSGNTEVKILENPRCMQVGKMVGNKWKHESMSRVYAPTGIFPTLNTCGGGNLQAKVITGASDENKVRKLTPKEYWRLMGFTDTDFAKAEEVCSNSQLYKQAGNSIVVNVLEHILRELVAI